MGNWTVKTTGSSSGISETGPTGCQSSETFDWPRMLVLMIGSRINATGGMVSTAPTIAPITPKPRKSPRVIGSFCNSANFSPLLEGPHVQLLPAKPGRRCAGLHRVIGLIIYREGHPRVGLHEAHVERHHRGHEPEEPYGHPPGVVRVPLRSEEHRHVTENEEADDEDEVYGQQIG